jgi:hypothetical protein
MASHNNNQRQKQSETMPLNYFEENWTFEQILKDTDERIESAEIKIMGCRVNIMKGMAHNDEKTIFRYRKTIQSYEISIKLMRVEKLLYQSLFITNNNSRLFPLLLSKYATLMTDALEIASELVNCDVYEMNQYMEVCEDSVKQHEYIKNLCGLGEKENN